MPFDLSEDIVIRKLFLSPQEQPRAARIVREISPSPYVPTTRWGKAMNLRMNCLGHHWSAHDYKYHSHRVDVDNQPCAPIPSELQLLAQRALIETAYLSAEELRRFDICIVNFYDRPTSKLGDHVDNSESPQARSGGYPVVSLSLGASCIFRIGGLKRTDPYEQFQLDSGDLVIFGRSMRLAFHGVKNILPNTTPSNLGIPDGQRINLTFRVL